MVLLPKTKPSSSVHQFGMDYRGVASIPPVIPPVSPGWLQNLNKQALILKNRPSVTERIRLALANNPIVSTNQAKAELLYEPGELPPLQRAARRRQKLQRDNCRKDRDENVINLADTTPPKRPRVQRSRKLPLSSVPQFVTTGNAASAPPLPQVGLSTEPVPTDPVARCASRRPKSVTGTVKPRPSTVYRRPTLTPVVNTRSIGITPAVTTPYVRAVDDSCDDLSTFTPNTGSGNTLVVDHNPAKERRLFSVSGPDGVVQHYVQSKCGTLRPCQIVNHGPLLDSPRSRNTPVSRRSDEGVLASQLYRVPNPAPNTLIGPCIACYKVDCPHSAPIRRAKLDMMAKWEDVRHNKPSEVKINAKNRNAWYKYCQPYFGNAPIRNLPWCVQRYGLWWFPNNKDKDDYCYRKDNERKAFRKQFDDAVRHGEHTTGVQNDSNTDSDERS